MYVNSPFEEEKRCLLLCRDVSSRYTRRGYEEYRRIAEYIARMSWKKKGNYMIFFPSYKLMEDVFEVYQEEFSADWVDCICQQASMNEREREEFLKVTLSADENYLLALTLRHILKRQPSPCGEELKAAAADSLSRRLSVQGFRRSVAKEKS